MWRPLMCALTVLAAQALGQGPARAADMPTLLTILEGDALVYRGTGRLQAVEGMSLAAGDIVETSATGFLQLELDDRAVLQFGPSTRAMFDAGTARKKPERWFYLMNGWAKLSGPPKDATGGTSPRIDLRAPLYELPAVTGTVVLQSSPTEVALFAEQGELKLVERGDKPVPLTVRAGEHYLRKAGSRGAVAAGVPPGFAAQLPRAFRDSLPLRRDRFADGDAKPKPASDFSYADVEVWLKAEPDVRRPFVKRWRVKAQDKAFRAALVDGLRAHPEWDPVLFPEKYLPKPKPEPAAAAASVPGSAASAP